MVFCACASMQASLLRKSTSRTFYPQYGTSSRAVARSDLLGFGKKSDISKTGRDVRKTKMSGSLRGGCTPWSIYRNNVSLQENCFCGGLDTPHSGPSDVTQILKKLKTVS